MIRIQNVTKKYRTKSVETTALNNVSFEIRKGEFVSVMGPSGCGKSTMLNVLGMLDKPNSGVYEFFDQEVSNYSKRQLTNLRLNIGFIFQNYNLIDDLTVYKNVELPLIYAKLGAKTRKEKVNRILHTLGLEKKKSVFPQQLSGGQQQRVAIARASVGEPSVILADEPTGNLDSKNGEEVMNLLSELNGNGTTIVMVTHSPTFAKYGHRIMLMHDGRIVEDNSEKGYENYSFPKKFF